MITVSVIITSYDNAHNLKACIKSLLEQDYDRSLITIEFLFVDSGSHDNSKLILNEYSNHIKIFYKPRIYSNVSRLSPAQARNIGAKHANGRFLIFSDSDCIFPKTWISTIIDYFTNFPIDCIIGNREPDIGNGLGTFVRRYDFILYSDKFTIEKPIIINKDILKGRHPMVLLAGNNFAIKKAVWHKLGGMKTLFKNPAGEDIMLEIDLLKRGYKLMFTPKIKVIHHHPISLKKLFKRASQNGEATYLLSKYSDNFVTWKNFGKRGRNFDMHKFILGILTVCLLVLFFLLFKISFVIVFVILSINYLIFLMLKLSATKKRLKMILAKKAKRYSIYSKISFLELFLFVTIHIFLKTITTANILWYSFVKK